MAVMRKTWELLSREYHHPHPVSCPQQPPGHGERCPGEGRPLPGENLGRLGHLQQVGDGGLHSGGAWRAEVYVDYVVRAGGANEGQGPAALSLREDMPA